MIACSVGDGIACMEDQWFVEAVGQPYPTFNCEKVALAQEWAEYLLTTLQHPNGERCCCNVKGIVSRIHLAKTVLSADNSPKSYMLVKNLNQALMLVFDIAQRNRKHKYVEEADDAFS